MIKTIMIFLVLSFQLFASPFIEIKSGRFEKNNNPYYFLGANFWQGMNLGAPGAIGNRKLLMRELDQMQKSGITQLRVLALSEGPENEPYRIVPAVQLTPTLLNEDLLKGLDFLLFEMSKRNMSAVICLSNFWPWSGGFAQWVSWNEGSSIPYPPPHPGGSWNVFQEYSSRFYTLPSAVKRQQESVRKIITRVNSLSAIPYKDDPTIMAWELANEPRGGKYRTEFLKWINSSAKLIKSLDKNHLVTIGSEGDTLNPEDAGNNFIEDHSIAEIDYATIHIWVENWGIYDPKNSSSSLPVAQQSMIQYVKNHVEKARIFKKPIILEEFGLARDNRSMDPKAKTVDRDNYFQAVFNETIHYMKMNGSLSGVNFWAWSGEGRPSFPYGSLWKQGDNFLGDPPHEEQGWYGVYSTDTSTLKIIREYSQKISELTKKGITK